VPTRFFFNVETVGGLEPDQIVVKGIETLQAKLAEVIQSISGGVGMDGADFGAPQSPQMNGAGYGGQDAGYTTPYGGGNASVWGNSGPAGGSTTPYGATPYGGGGGPNW
jgi:DNA-directed RNA polymerase II subunit RPB3